MNKGFTLVELLGVIIIISIISGIAVVSVTYILENSRNSVYKNYESTLSGSARNYLIKNIDKRPQVGGSLNVSYNDLKTGGFIDTIKDPKGGNCNSSYVKITRGADKGINYTFNYKACLVCTNYRSEGC